MKKQKGLTLIELMIIVAIIGILISVLFTNGLIGDGTTCRGGFKFTWQGHQVFDEYGHGVKCN